MGIVTNRLGMAVGDYNDYESVELDHNANMDLIDKKVNLFPCTAATRPTLLYRGQLIVELDTKKIYVGDLISGVLSWVLLKQTNEKGLMGFTNDAADSAAITGGAADSGPFFPITFVADPLRRYWVEVNVKLSLNGNSTPCECLTNIRYAAGPAVTYADTPIDGAGGRTKLWAYRGVDQPTYYYRTWEFPISLSGQITAALFLNNITVGGGASPIIRGGAGLSNMMVIRDMGAF